jgi:exodeoxyribonuclease V alpha subunit
VRTAEIDSIDQHFGDFVMRLSPGCEKGVFLAAALTSLATREGHTCLELPAWEGGKVIAASGRSYQVPELQRWLQEVSLSPAVGTPEDLTPLVHDDHRLYLRRYWEYEKDIAEFVIERGSRPDRKVDPDVIVGAMKRLFPDNSGGGCDWQSLAALAVLIRPFVVIAGGPGTGKTTTVAKIIALVIEHGSGGEVPRIALAAPTGKAVMRLQGVMTVIRDSLACPEQIRAQIPGTATTLHRLLGPRKGTPFFKHNARNLLPYDMVIIDEASMVDLPLMAKLMRALSPDARLVLLGDRYQLASVEPGAVLGDLCRREQLTTFSSSFIKCASRITEVGGLSESSDCRADSLVELRTSHRFEDKSGIGLLSRAMNHGDAEGALKILCDGSYPDVVWRQVDNAGRLREELKNRFSNESPAWFGSVEPGQALQEMGRSQLLCAIRKGVFGVDGVNSMVEEILSASFPIVPGGTYQGRPVMISLNDYEMGLYNGDTGVVMAEPGEAARTFAFFPGQEGDCRKVALTMLPPHETIFAMTIHKSQGSEFDQVVVILPDHRSAVLSLELLYTAITRARKRLEIWGDPKIFREAVSVALGRHSGLRDRLTG